ncbi:MAG TPA: hypothetical protein VFS37_07545 [Conexibacter sp.]|nr:hypothetical protein [Conexibacter sp.]
MGRRSRQRAREQKLSAPSTDYRSAEGDVLTLRGAMSPATRREYAAVRAGGGAVRAAATQEDAWQRAAEFLFERLAVRWEIAGAPIDRQQELLARYRVASPDERAWIRGVLREHLAEWFPDVQAP